jgi:drug/metabolite transporter (DMT)-like permease
MEQNVGSTDRYVRIIVGIVLGVVGIAVFAGPLASLGTIVGALALIVGVVFLGTGLTQRCLLYQPFGINTLRRN